MDHTKKRFGKKDAVFIGLLLIIAILIFFFTNYFQKETGAMVTVAVDGKVYGTYDLEKEQTIDIKAGDKTTNILRFQTERQKCLPPIARISSVSTSRRFQKKIRPSYVCQIK